MPASRTDAFSFRDRFPQPVKALVKTGVEAYGQTTSGSRVLPDFVIVGAQRAGTTAMYEYLTEHPSIASATTEEVHYADLHHDRGLSWYRGHFPTQARMEGIAERTGHAITGEASPYCLFHPLAAPPPRAGCARRSSDRDAPRSGRAPAVASRPRVADGHGTPPLAVRTGRGSRRHRTGSSPARQRRSSSKLRAPAPLVFLAWPLRRPARAMVRLLPCGAHPHRRNRAVAPSL